MSRALRVTGRIILMTKLRGVFVFALAGLLSISSGAQEARGTLIFDLKPFTSEVELKEKVEKQLKSGGLEWGTAAGQMVVSMVSKQYIRFDLSNFTRYGEKKTLEVGAGEYRITCAGFVPEGGLSIEKVLKKGAYFNVDILTFTVKPGGTTTIEVHPTIRKERTFFLKFFLPELLVKVDEDGTITGQKVINERTDASIAWDDYKGPLKF